MPFCPYFNLIFWCPITRGLISVTDGATTTTALGIKVSARNTSVQPFHSVHHHHPNPETKHSSRIKMALSKVMDTLKQYRQFVVSQPLIAAEVESALRWISYFAAGNVVVVITSNCV